MQRSWPPAPHPQPKRSLENGERPRRAPAAQVHATAAPMSHPTLLSFWLHHIISGGGALMTARTSMGMFKGAPPGPGAADALAAIAYARSGVSTSTIQNPARNSLDSGKTPSVIGTPFLPARTNLACSGNERPSADTSSPESPRSLFRFIMNAM